MESKDKMSYRIGKAPYKSHRSNVGYRGLLHRIFGKKLVIKRTLVFGSGKDARHHHCSNNGGIK